MAIAEMEVKVALEEVLHTVLKDFAMQYFKEHNVKINSIHFDWIEFSNIDVSYKGEIVKTTIDSTGT